MNLAASAQPTLRHRTRIAAVPLKLFPESLRDAGAIAVLSVVAFASAVVSSTRQIVVAIGPMREIAPRRSLQREWRQRLAVLRPLLEEHARAAVHDTTGMLAADERRRQRTLADRANLVEDALQTPLAAHFVQRELFAAPDAQSSLRPRPVRARSAGPELPPLVLMDVSLLLVPVREASDARLHAGTSPR